MTVTYNLPRFGSTNSLVPYATYDKEPEYLILGGLVFQPLTDSYLQPGDRTGNGALPSAFIITTTRIRPKTSRPWLSFPRCCLIPTTLVIRTNGAWSWKK